MTQIFFYRALFSLYIGTLACAYRHADGNSLQEETMQRQHDDAPVPASDGSTLEQAIHQLAEELRLFNDAAYAFGLLYRVRRRRQLRLRLLRFGTRSHFGSVESPPPRSA